MRAVLIAGTQSGVGKTSVAAGLMGSLTRRGLKVQPFKAGPDYIDPGYHTAATGRKSRNLDTWMLSRESVLELFNRAACGADIAVIEGVMGLYDGRTAITDEGSTAELAKILKVPVILVVDCRKGARSLAATVAGYHGFDPSLNLAGIILNGIGSERHLDLCKQAIEHYTGIPVVGHLPRRPDLSIPERHLGLVPTVEREEGGQLLDSLICQCEDSMNTSAILNISKAARVPATKPLLFPQYSVPRVATIGVAYDRAFSFYYQDSLDILEAWGAELIYFSPISDSALPAGVSGIYMGGGFPELYAEHLSSNLPMLDSIRMAAKRGMPIYAECGGLMYLSEKMLDMQGKEYTMSGIVPGKVRIDAPRLSLGYRTVEAISDGPLLAAGQVARGHEFHWSVLYDCQADMNAYRIVGTDGIEGFQIGNTIASYIHLHMAAVRSMACRFIGFCHSKRYA